MITKAVFLIILAVIFLYGMLLSVVEMRSAGNPIPDNVSDVYDEEAYRKWRAYSGEKSRLEVFSGTASFVVQMILMGFNIYAAFAGLFPNTLFLQMVAVLLVVILADLFTIPFFC